MKIMEFFRGGREPTAVAAPEQPKAMAGSEQIFSGLDDPDLHEFMRAGSATESGAYVSAEKALKNMALLRCVRVISECIGMLPLNVYEKGPDKRKADEHPLTKLLRRRPNNWQSAYDFKRLLQLWALVHGDAYARIVRGVGRKPIALVPMHPTRTKAELSDGWEMEYTYTPENGGAPIKLRAEDVFHLRDLSMNGVNGISRVKLANEAIGLALQAEKAAARLFRNGMMVGGALKHPEQLSEPAHKRLKEAMDDRYTGSENAHRWMILEEGMTAEQFAQTATDSQHIENRNHQIEEIARAFGVPRPLLMMDDTSWGSGIEQLGIFFVQYTLQPWFTAWEQAIGLSLFTETEAERYYAKFNERALLRGTLKDQSEFFKAALGSGGHAPWMSVNEIRDLSELPESDEDHAGSLKTAAMKTAEKPPAPAAPAEPPTKGKEDEPAVKPA